MFRYYVFQNWEKYNYEVNDIEQKTKEIWLGYFNRVLFEKGIITEQERNKMNHLIYLKCHPKKQKK